MTDTRKETAVETAARIGSSSVKGYDVKNIALDLIVPDENQPRKDFDAGRLSDLMKSIKLHGIITPLVVERFEGKYLLVDGERRFRAAKELKMTEVPALIQEAKSGVDRLIQQFHIQEQHEGWTGTEKAAAVIDLAKHLNLSVVAVSELLAVPQRTIGRYLAFGKLLAKSEFQKAEISLEYATSIVAIREFVKKQYMDVLNEEFDKGQERELEHTIIARIKNGEIQRRQDLVKLHDSIKADPKSVEKFMGDSKLTLSKLFLDSNAKAAFAFRNIKFAANAINTYVKSGLPLGVKAMIDEDEEMRKSVSKARASLSSLL